MAILTDVPARSARSVRPLPGNGLALRFRLLGRAAVGMVTAFVGVALFCFWVTFVALSPFTLLAWTVLPLTTLVRRYADANRLAASRVLGEPIPRPYRPVRDARWLARVWAIVRDPASWRDMAWTLVQSTVCVFLRTLQVSLFLASVLYLIFPFLYWVTPQDVFGRPFGLFELHTVGQSFLLTPVAALAISLWIVLAVPLSRADAVITRALLR